jgi:hypothetical protein
LAPQPTLAERRQLAQQEVQPEVAPQSQAVLRSQQRQPLCSRRAVLREP